MLSVDDNAVNSGEVHKKKVYYVYLNVFSSIPKGQLYEIVQYILKYNWNYFFQLFSLIFSDQKYLWLIKFPKSKRFQSYENSKH